MGYIFKGADGFEEYVIGAVEKFIYKCAVFFLLLSRSPGKICINFLRGAVARCARNFG